MTTPYFNPAASKPDVGQVPAGLAGVWMNQQNQDYRNAMSLQDALSRTGVNQAEAEYQTYTQDEPLRAAKRSQGIGEADLAAMVARAGQNEPGYGSAMARGAMGKAGTEEAAGQVALGTAKGKINSENAASHLKETQTFLNHLDLQEPVFQDSTPGSTPGSTRGQEAYRGFIQQLPKSAQSAFGQEYSPERMKQVRAKLENSIEQANKMAQGRLHNEGTAEVARITAAGKLAAVQARVEKMTRGLWESFLRAPTTEMRQSLGEQILASLDPEDPQGTNAQITAQVKAGIEQARRSEAERRAQGQMPFPGLPQPGAAAPGIQQRLAPGQGGQPGGVVQWGRDANGRPVRLGQ